MVARTSIVDQHAIQRHFDRGVEWALENVRGLGYDARMSVLASLLLIDPESARSTAAVLQSRRDIRLSAVGRIFNVVTFGEVRRRLDRRRSEVDAFFAVMQRDPSPVIRTDLDSYRHRPESLPDNLEDLHGIDAAHTQAALIQAGLGRLGESTLSWLRREDLWGYNLCHQLLAWVACVKAGHRTDEALERAAHLSWRVFHEVEHGPVAVHYDLFVERVAFLLLAGFSSDRLVPHLLHVLAAQDVDDGGWWFTRTRDDHAVLLENAHLGSSPLIKPARSYRDQADPEAARRNLEILHRGHATALSVWALALWMTAFPNGDVAS